MALLIKLVILRVKWGVEGYTKCGVSNEKRILAWWVWSVILETETVQRISTLIQSGKREHAEHIIVGCNIVA
jgi:hypothetical protein